MKACTICNRVLPDTSFPARDMTRTRLHAWCRDCYQIKREEWKRNNPHHTSSWKEETRPQPDAIQWARLHCQHIANYVTRVSARFESKTGLECPPQLLAIRQLADQVTEQLPERPRAAKSAHIVCRNCGREYFPTSHRYSAYCSKYCKERFKQVADVMEGKRLPPASRTQEQARRKEEKDASAKALRKEREREDAKVIQRASHAVELRQAGWKWKDIAAELGYSSPAGPYVAIQQSLKLDPKTLRMSSGQRVEK